MGFLSGTLLALSVGTVCLVGVVTGHGRLIDPPSRSSMWRYGYRNPPNYNDNQLYCGGVQVKTNTSFMTRSEIFLQCILNFFRRSDLNIFRISKIFHIWTFFSIRDILYLNIFRVIWWFSQLFQDRMCYISFDKSELSLNMWLNHMYWRMYNFLSFDNLQIADFPFILSAHF